MFENIQTKHFVEICKFYEEGTIFSWWICLKGKFLELILFFSNRKSELRVEFKYINKKGGMEDLNIYFLIEGNLQIISEGVSEKKTRKACLRNLHVNL